MKCPELQTAARQPWKLFSTRLRSARQLQRMLPYEQVPPQTLEEALQNSTAPSPRVIYIHIPFCTRACIFCGYYKCLHPEKQQIANFCRQLQKQIEWLGSSSRTQTPVFEAVYFGGGTPSAIPAGYLSDILLSLREHLPLADDCEISMETTFRELDKDYLDLLSEGAINRVSLGVQTFDPEIRRRYNRYADREAMRQAILSVRESGIFNIAIDLMYNLEGQTSRTWTEDLEYLKQLPVQGCSVYPLVPQPDAPLVREQRYREPDAGEEFDRFMAADEFFQSRKTWHCLTPVHYCHPEKGPARYLQAQAQQADVVGLGPGAGGKIGALQYVNTFGLEEFLSGEGFTSEKTRVFRLPEPIREVEDKLRLFRSNREDREIFERHFSDRRLRDSMFDGGFLKEESGKMQLTPLGRFWALNLAALIICEDLSICPGE